MLKLLMFTKIAARVDNNFQLSESRSELPVKFSLNTIQIINVILSGIFDLQVS